MSIQIAGAFNSGAAVGNAGVATANATSAARVGGRVAAIYIKGNDSPPNTTDITIATAGTHAPAITLLTITNYTADAWYFPRVAVHDTAGVALTLDGTHAATDLIPIDDLIKVTIAQANAADSIDVTIILE